MGCAAEIVELMHKVLDEEADEKERHDLKVHLNECRVCREHFEQLKKAETIIQGTSHVTAPDHLKQKVMGNLPKENRTSSLKRWFQEHAVFTAAAMFLVLMAGYFFSLWEAPQGVSVIGQGHVEQHNGVVVVPEGEVINGDLIVRNSDIRINGKVNGNVTVINGQQYSASVGQVSGQIEEVDQVMEWIWYQIKHLFTGFVWFSAMCKIFLGGITEVIF